MLVPISDGSHAGAEILNMSCKDWSTFVIVVLSIFKSINVWYFGSSYVGSSGFRQSRFSSTPKIWWWSSP